MIRITGYGVVAEKPRVGQLGRIFPCTLRWIKKWMHLFDGLEELYHHAKFREDSTMRTGCRCENVMFVFSLFFLVTLR